MNDNNNAKQIEFLVRSIVRTEAGRVETVAGAEPLPMVQPDAVPETIVRARDKIQPSQQEESEGIKSPLTQTGALELYEPVLHTDSTGILTFVYKPVKAAVFNTSDATPKQIRFNFTDVQRPSTTP